MFVPKHLQQWRPEHMRATPMRRCHFCASGPHRLGELIQVLESPMRYHFCKDTCLRKWQQVRHDDDVVEWLKNGAGQRAKIQKTYQHEQAEAEDCGAARGVRSVDHVEVSMQSDQ